MKRTSGQLKRRILFAGNPVHILSLTIIFLLIFSVGSGFNALIQGAESGESRFGIMTNESYIGYNLQMPDFNLVDDKDTLELDILNPTESLLCDEDGDILEWFLETNNWKLQLDIQSIGYEEEENDDWINLAQPYTNEFFRYTFRTDDSSFDRLFYPGGEEISLYDIDSDIGGIVKFEYDSTSFTGDRLWCANSAGKYRDIIRITISGEPLMPDKCETAWAYYNKSYSETFKDLGIGINWGWSSGPLGPGGEYELGLWRGAAQNDLSKGTEVGTVTVDFHDRQVIYELFDGYYLSEVHLFIGNDHPKSPAPGQLGYTNDELFVPGVVRYEISFDDVEFSQVNFGKGIYIAAHAKVCWYE